MCYVRKLAFRTSQFLRYKRYLISYQMVCDSTVCSTGLQLIIACSRWLYGLDISSHAENVVVSYRSVCCSNGNGERPFSVYASLI